MRDGLVGRAGNRRWVRVWSPVAGGAPRCGCGAASVVGRGPWRWLRPRRGADDQRGSVALLALLGGGLALLIALVPVVVVADLMVSRARAQTAADAAALAAMADPTGEGRGAAVRVGHANAAEVVECCGRDPGRRDVTAAVRPVSWLLATVVPRIEARAAAALVAASSGVVDATAISAGATVTAGAAGGGARMWPVVAPVSSGFGVRTHPITGTRRLHAGIDLGAPAGTPIRAAATGLVVAAGPMGGYGNTVDVAHADGTTTRYAHQSRVLVRAGQQVAAGQVIGLVGSTGASTGPHLHFEVRTPAGPTDPTGWLP